MKKYITLALMIIFCIVLDHYAIKGLHAPFVESFKREFLYQYFSGSFFDWVSLIALNVLWLGCGWFASREEDFYEETPYPFIFTLLIGSIFFLCLIYWL